MVVFLVQVYYEEASMTFCCNAGIGYELLLRLRLWYGQTRLGPKSVLVTGGAGVGDG